MKIPPYSLVLGVPAKVVKTLDAETETKIQSNVDEYVARAAEYLKMYSNSL
jgi:carbonic anhydrase/acetyltransferase-like protein (isoleucine patch superfamily)